MLRSIKSELKSASLVLQACTNGLLDDFSTRLCFGCKQAHAQSSNKFYCKQCYAHLAACWQEQTASRKNLDFSYTELSEFFAGAVVHYPKIYFACEYNSLTKSLMRNFKYRAPYVAKFWAEILAGYWQRHADWILSDLNNMEIDRFDKSHSSRELNISVAAVPMSDLKLRSRSYNQADLIADNFVTIMNHYIDSQSYLYQSSEGLGYSSVSNFNYLPDLLWRVKHTPSLYDKSKLERLEIMRGAFELASSSVNLSQGDNILIIVDDITTTGATFLEIYRTLLKSDTIWDEIIFLAVCGRNMAK